MNINKFTQSSLAAVQGCEKIAMEYGNQEIEQEHLLYALLTIDDSLILKLFEKMGITKESAVNRVEEAIRKRPKVQGGQMFIGKDLNNVLIYAEDEAKQMGDEYVSVEHLLLSMIKHANKEMKQIFREFGISREGFLQALSTVRGNQRVTSDNPEATYDTLNKYGQDLVERAMHESTNPRKRELKPVMVHCQFARRDQYERMRTLGVIPSIFVAHTWYWGDTHIANMGMGRASEISRVHDALELGLPFTFHTDSPVIEPNLFESVWCAATRVTKAGVQLDPAQRVGIYDGLQAVTVNAAAQYGELNRKGTLEVGKLADLAIVARNPLDCDVSPDSADSPTALRNLQVLATIKAGRLIWQHS